MNYSRDATLMLIGFQVKILHNFKFQVKIPSTEFCQ